ncbi:DUF1289 domain-containing protein [Burkholderia sp. PAMC 28687]|uniref:DUF1289 domain-containing protein n=1 Tax=Burkholderia sp. PAMC 28687 TaxID=1795874 RepID=UPI0009EB9E15|nr:DUF1289 domain-containing protein [Burkholderia sp. PAMC 28687]
MQEEEVSSPCVGLCSFHARTGFCIGCSRTAEEARLWHVLNFRQRMKIIEDRDRRINLTIDCIPQ